MEAIEIDYFKCIEAPAYVMSSTTTNEWFNLIRNENEFTPYIKKARTYIKGSDEYNFIKRNNIPCTAFNFIFNKYKKDKNIVGGTGLIFFDVDDKRFDINSLSSKNYFAYYKSFGGNGYSILARVYGLTLENFKYNYYKIASELGIEELLDTGSIKATQYNVLSYDPDLNVNEKSKAFTAENKEYVKENVEVKSFFNIFLSTKEEANEFLPLRYDNLNEIEVDGPYIVNWEGWNYVKCYYNANKKISDGRKNFMLGYTRNLVWLNPHMSKERCLNSLSAMNIIAFDIPLEKNIIFGIIKSIFDQKEEGTLVPKIYPKKRKFAFNFKEKFSRDEKMAIVHHEIRNKRKDESTQKLYDIIESWNFSFGNISVRNIAKNNPISIKTVTKYYPEFKELISELNLKNKNK